MTPTVQMRRLRLIQVVIQPSQLSEGRSSKVPYTDWLQQETLSQLQLEVCTGTLALAGWSSEALGTGSCSRPLPLAWRQLSSSPWVCD